MEMVDAEDEEGDDGAVHLENVAQVAGDPLLVGPVPPPFHHRIEELFRMRGFAAKILVCTSKFPLAFAEYSRQLGYEPFPLSLQRRFWFFGAKNFYTPNVFRYLNLYRRAHGWQALFPGFDTAMTCMIVGDFAEIYIGRKLNNEWLQMGGAPIELEAAQLHPPGYDFFRDQLRFLIRKSVQVLFTTAVVHPLKVVFVREVAQNLVTGMSKKYVGNLLSKLSQIAREEGLSGLFAGFVPTLLQRLLFTWLTIGMNFLCLYVIGRMKSRGIVHSLFKNLPAGVFHFNAHITYPLRACFPLLAVNKSGLPFISPPHVPAFDHWTDVRAYLRTRDPYRGIGLLGRMHVGPVRLGLDRQFYALTSFDL